MKIRLAWLIVTCLSLSAFSDSKDWESRIQNFAQSPQWLGHFFYREEFGGITSIVTTPSYFLSINGKTDPSQELIKAIAILSEQAGMDETKYCRHVGRYELILSQFPELRKPYHRCTAFENWYSKLGIDEVRVSFATGYIKNPASSFGHLFLKLVSKNRASELLNYGISFSAYTGRDTGVEYALKGILGYYPGGFSFMPYHQLIKDYSDLEGRDIWELDLELDSAQIRNLLLFVYEFDGHTIDYTFLNNNCSGILEHLIFNVKNIRFKGMSEYKPWRIPLESYLNLIEYSKEKKQIYYPSLKTQQKNLERELSLEEKREIKKELGTKDFTHLSPRSMDYILLDKKSEELEGFDNNYYNQILLARSKLPIMKTEENVLTPKFDNQYTSLFSLVSEEKGLGLNFDLLSDRLIYRRSLSEINILSFQIRKNTISEVNFFDFLAGEAITFLRQPVSFGGGIAYRQNEGIVGNLSAGLIYNSPNWMYFPKFKIEQNEFSPELDFYFYTKPINLRLNLNAYKTNVELLKIIKSYSISAGYLIDLKTKSGRIEARAGRIF